MPKYKKWKLVVVEWEDVCLTCGWASGSDKPSPSIVYSVGWLMRETRSRIVLCPTLVASGPPRGDSLGTLTLPRGMIRKIRNIHT
jgi:hypothetical protein